MKTEDKKLIIIKIQEDLKKNLQEILKKEDKTITLFLKECIKDYVKKNSQ